jgi:hypothetical protein
MPRLKPHLKMVKGESVFNVVARYGTKPEATEKVSVCLPASQMPRERNLGMSATTSIAEFKIRLK